MSRQSAAITLLVFQSLNVKSLLDRGTHILYF